MSRHLLCRDTFSMYRLFYHVNVPLMRGHLLNADRIFWFSVPAKADSNHYFRDFFLEIFYFQNGNGQTARCVLGKQCYIADSDIRLLIVDLDCLPPGEMPNVPA